MCSMRDFGRKSSRRDENPGFGRYTLAGKSILCPHCNGEEFEVGEAQLNTAFATLLKLDWTNKSATILTCASCGQIQWFQKQPARVS